VSSLIESYLRQRDLRNFQRSQELTIAAQLSAVDEQVRRLLSQDGCSPAELARSDYLHHYLVGILDAITSFYERETRKRLGLELYRDVFVRYLSNRFLVARREAEALFAAVGAEPQHSGMRDGYADGLQALRGGTPRRLLDCYARRGTAVESVAMMTGFSVAVAATA
jgi:hypothetical protein